jgi:hypothetical protein
MLFTHRMDLYVSHNLIKPLPEQGMRISVLNQQKFLLLLGMKIVAVKMQKKASN